MSLNASAGDELRLGRLEIAQPAAAGSRSLGLTRADLDAIREAVRQEVLGRISKPAQRLLAVEEAACYLGRSPRAIRGLLAGGQFPAVRADGRVQIDIRDLDQWIEKNKRDVV